MFSVPGAMTSSGCTAVKMRDSISSQGAVMAQPSP